MRIEGYIDSLITYAVEKKWITEEDRPYFRNIYLDVFGMDDYQPESETYVIVSEDAENSLAGCLNALCDEAVARGIIEDTVARRDLFDTKLMGIITPRPGEVKEAFYKLYEKDKKAATDYYYTLSKDCNYIRVDRIRKDMKWKAQTEYGDLDITINLSKPEKDPRDIAASGAKKSTSYPKCQLCYENEGFAGHLNHPARQNLRIIPIELNGQSFGLQYSPYVYYNEHCIVLNKEHVPMKIDRACFNKLLDFVTVFPHYFIGSNADLPIVGGSILSHDHFQGGNYEFPMAKSEIEEKLVFKGFEDVNAGIVKWPMSVIRIQSKEKVRLAELAEKILNAWREYSDESLTILADTDGVKHNTITPITRRRGDLYEMDLVLRNNLTSEEHPLGIYHPHAKLHHIKKENIGLIEVMGLAVLPSRLKKELADLIKALSDGRNIREDEVLAKHADWVDEIMAKCGTPLKSEKEIADLIYLEVGKVFSEVLTDAGVYKRDAAGKAGFIRFAEYVNTRQ